ncbi:MAG: UTP--glucose-1-phosphate uridylyltransferase, partial [Synergistaceae bacterium]|nr:UTP--glucose-1-phosphate uridylyltransferase [Synergistaceae bacterium]
YFGVILPDDVFINDVPVLKQLIQVHYRLGGSVVALEVVEPANISRYGVIAGDEHEPGILKISDMIEKPKLEDAPSNYAIMGRYVLSPTIFSLLKQQNAGTGGEIQLTDALRNLIKYEPVWGVVYRGRRFDCGTQKGWLSANVQLALEDPVLRDVILEVVNGK